MGLKRVPWGLWVLLGLAFATFPVRLYFREHSSIDRTLGAVALILLWTMLIWILLLMRKNPTS